MKQGKTQVSRRSFLAGAGMTALGVGVARVPFNTANAIPQTDLPPLPWTNYYPSAGLDVDAVREQAYYRDQAGGCGYGGAQAIIDALAEQLPYPWAKLPKGDVDGVGMFSYAGGGVAKWGTICGSLNGVIGVMGLLGVPGELRDALMDYYCTAELPTSNLHCVDPGSTCDLDMLPEVVTSISYSPLCHVSVSKWAVAQGVPISDPLKKVRCGRLVGDIAARAVELLNDYFLDGHKPEAWTPDGDTADCMTCHKPTSTDAPAQLGKMDCLECHDLPNMHGETPLQDPPWKAGPSNNK